MIEKKERNSYVPSGMPQDVCRRARAIHHNQRSRCKNPNNKKYRDYGGKGIRVEYHINDFLDWYWAQYQAWPQKKDIQVGRIDHARSYALDNICFQTREENGKEVTDRRGPVKPKKRVGIFWYKTGELIAIASSLLDAAKCTGTFDSNVSRYCTGKNGYTKTRKGFSFKYMEAS